MIRLRTFNHLLSIVVVVIGVYILITPLLPQVSYWLRDTSPETLAPFEGELAKSQGSSSSLAIPKENRLLIPSIGINEPIKESTTIDVIKDGGTWRRPQTAVPTDIDNTVIVGHRYYGSEVSTFYHLDKVEIGQDIAIYWDGKEILYEVSEIKVVPATAIEIEAPTDEKLLTLYTCTPVWTGKDRLVVVAKPIKTLQEGFYE